MDLLPKQSASCRCFHLLTFSGAFCTTPQKPAGKDAPRELAIHAKLAIADQLASCRAKGIGARDDTKHVITTDRTNALSQSFLNCCCWLRAPSLFRLDFDIPRVSIAKLAIKIKSAAVSVKHLCHLFNLFALN
jgi:hypothetical protein